MTQQKPDLSKITQLLNQSVQGMPKGKPSPQSPPPPNTTPQNAPPQPVDPDRPSCLERVQSFTLRLLTLGAIVSISAFFGAIVSLGLVPPQITLNIPKSVITAPPIVITARPIVVTPNPLTITATPMVVFVEVTKNVPMLVTVEVVREVAIEVTREVPVTVEVIKPVAIEVTREVIKPVAITPTPFSVFTLGGISYENYQLLQEGMTYAQVVQILGEEGVESSNSGDYVYYTWEGSGGSIRIMFNHGKLTTKSQSLK